jgi:hypothetical protein
MLGILITSSRLRAAVLASALASVGTGVAGLAFASSPYDGNWSVLITTRVGACEPTTRYRLQITDGAVVNAAGNDVDVRGQVSRGGTVSVSVRSGEAWAVASGRLSGETGSGTWKGKGSNGACEGTWTAERRGAGAAFAPLGSVPLGG